MFLHTADRNAGAAPKVCPRFSFRVAPAVYGTQNALINLEWRSPKETGRGGLRTTAASVRHAVTRMHIKRSIAASLATAPFAGSVLRQAFRLRLAALGVSPLTNEPKWLVHKWLPEQFG